MLVVLLLLKTDAVPVRAVWDGFKSKSAVPVTSHMNLVKKYKCCYNRISPYAFGFVLNKINMRLEELLALCASNIGRGNESDEDNR